MYLNLSIELHYRINLIFKSLKKVALKTRAEPHNYLNRKKLALWFLRAYHQVPLYTSL